MHKRFPVFNDSWKINYNFRANRKHVENLKALLTYSHCLKTNKTLNVSRFVLLFFMHVDFVLKKFLHIYISCEDEIMSQSPCASPISQSAATSTEPQRTL